MKPLSIALLFFLAVDTNAQAESMVLPLRERATLMDDWLALRLDTVAPAIMREAGVDTWIVIAREYNEDPVIDTMLPATWMSARRRTILVFHDPPSASDAESGFERMAVARYDIGRFFESAWNKDEQPDQWARLGDLVASFDPKKIAVDISGTFALGDGLSASQSAELISALGDNAERITSDHNLPIRWLETRTPEEMATYPTICSIAHRIIADGFTPDQVKPGTTTTADLEWWYRERIAEWKLATWFHPSVSLQRVSAGGSGEFASHAGAMTIERGDLLHVDFGITYLGLNTDTQQHAYVLRDGEDEAPAGLVHALAVGNRLQEILMSSFVAGRTGNQILAGSLQRARREGIEPSIYTHPLGYHGHGAGTTIGLWDQQGGVPGRGDFPLYANTAHSIELNVSVAIPEWDGEVIRIMLEEDAFFDGKVCRFIDGRQTEFHLIR